MTVDNKLELMQIALEVFKIEAKNRGNHQVSFFLTYSSLKDEIEDSGQVKRMTRNKIEDLPTASEYFNNKNLGVDSKKHDNRDMDQKDLESYNTRIR